ncbi:MAG: hypothetical protein WB810_14835 [Candidatus Cybelea sp.]
MAEQDGVTYDLTQSRAAIANVDWMTWNGVPLGQQGDLEPKPRRCR